MTLSLLQVEVQELSTLAVATPNRLYNAKCHLYKSKSGDTPPQLKSFSEAGFTGYPANGDTITWDGPRVFPDGSWGQTGRVVFDGTQNAGTEGNTTVDTILGYYITTSDSMTLLGWEQLPAPVSLGGSYTQLDLCINLKLRTDASYGDSTPN